MSIKILAGAIAMGRHPERSEAIVVPYVDYLHDATLSRDPVLKCSSTGFSPRESPESRLETNWAEAQARSYGATLGPVARVAGSSLSFSCSASWRFRSESAWRWRPALIA